MLPIWIAPCPYIENLPIYNLQLYIFVCIHSLTSNLQLICLVESTIYIIFYNYYIYLFHLVQIYEFLLYSHTRGTNLYWSACKSCATLERTSPLRAGAGEAAWWCRYRSSKRPTASCPQ